MRSQNPPHDHIQKARDIEKYLTPTSIVAIYAVLGISYLGSATLVFLGLFYDAILRSSPSSIIIAGVIAFLPSILAILACFIRPNDPLSLYLTKQAARWLTPIPVSPDPCTFKALMKNGETATIGLSFYYPQNFQSTEIKERLYSCIYAALGNGFSSRAALPTYEETEELLDFAAESVAAEYNIPVLYMKVTSLSQFRETHSPYRDSPTLSGATGTLG